MRSTTGSLTLERFAADLRQAIADHGAPNWFAIAELYPDSGDVLRAGYLLFGRCAELSALVGYELSVARLGLVAVAVGAPLSVDGPEQAR